MMQSAIEGQESEIGREITHIGDKAKETMAVIRSLTARNIGNILGKEKPTHYVI